MKRAITAAPLTGETHCCCTIQVQTLVSAYSPRGSRWLVQHLEVYERIQFNQSPHKQSGSVCISDGVCVCLCTHGHLILSPVNRQYQVLCVCVCVCVYVCVCVRACACAEWGQFWMDRPEEKKTQSALLAESASPPAKLHTGPQCTAAWMDTTLHEWECVCESLLCVCIQSCVYFVCVYFSVWESMSGHHSCVCGGFLWLCLI